VRPPSSQQPAASGAPQPLIAAAAAAACVRMQGLAFADKWGPLRLSANMAFIALAYSQGLPAGSAGQLRYTCWAISQMRLVRMRAGRPAERGTQWYTTGIDADALPPAGTSSATPAAALSWAWGSRRPASRTAAWPPARTRPSPAATPSCTGGRVGRRCLCHWVEGAPPACQRKLEPGATTAARAHPWRSD
jgi:hypothetical protein